MTESELKFKLQKKYDYSTWKELLTSVFPKVEYLLHPTILAEKTDSAKSVQQIGNLAISDGNIGIFEVEVSSRKKIARNRVELRKIAASYIDQGIIHGAFVFYFTSNQNDYRFTFIAKKSNLTEEGELVKYQTPPKRYTYVLGPNESCTTAAKRLIELEKNEEVTLDSIIQAFSIEKLTKEFFTKYKKEHYELFCDYLANSSYRKSVFNIPHHKDKKENAKAEKPIRDFIKLLLGRIVFLHFLQKKGWLGCPADIEEWKDGDPKFMQNLFVNFKDKKHFHSECLTELFFDTLNNHKRKNNIFSLTNTRVPYLNGGLFDNSHSEYNDIDFPKELFENLFDFFSQYNFTIDESSPDEHEVGIDPEMLGHIFENLLEDNKDKGAFYTPKEIVHYMCHESLIQYLITNMSDRAEPRASEEPKAIQNFIHTQEVSQFIRDNAKEIDSLLDKVKICDPAIGSGAFPMGLLKEIFQAKILLYPYIKTNRSFNPGAVKRNIIQNSIYGVDIDSGAVDIARLRFWLALIVDEEEPTPLPNLDYKIMQGNSLLESFEGINLNTSFDEEKFRVTLVNNQINMFSGDVVDPQYQVNFTNQQKLEIKELTETYFKETNKSEKQKIHRKIETKVLDHIEMNLELYKNRKAIELAELKHELNGRIKNLNKLSSKKQYLNKNKPLKQINQIRSELKEIRKKYASLKALEETTERPYFLWHFYFKDVFDKGGFDIVIGNPPYGACYPEKYKEYFIDKYESAKTKDVTIENKTIRLKGSLDTFSLFIDKSIDIMNNKSFFAFIVPLAITSSDSMTSLHHKIFQKCDTIKVSSYSNRPRKIFDSADQRVSIILASKNGSKIKRLYTTKVNKRYESTTIKDVINNLSYVDSIEFVKYGRIPKVGTSIELKILRKLFSSGTSLRDLVNVESGLPVYYRTSGGRYYNIVTNFPTNSSKENSILIERKYKDVVAALLSSNLYFWFYHIYSNNLDLKTYELNIFPIPVENLTQSKIDDVEKYYDAYLKDLHRHSKIKTVNYAHVSEYREYYARHSKHIIDKIDLAIKDVYGLNDEEMEFIINYDIEFRTDSIEE